MEDARAAGIELHPGIDDHSPTHRRRGGAPGQGGNPFHVVETEMSEADQMSRPILEAAEGEGDAGRADGGGPTSLSAVRGQRYSVMPYHQALMVKVNLYPLVLLVLYVIAIIFYFTVRATKTLVPGPSHWYGVFILVVEAFGVTGTLPYAILLVRSMLPVPDAIGLPPATEMQGTSEEYKFTIHVLIPCYKEDLEILRETVAAASDALLPYGAERFIYLCDDGGDDKKRAMMETIPNSVYITGRERNSKELNGKSNNLNNCLKNVIYKDPRDATEIPETEVVVVIDADMVASKDFYLQLLEPLTDPGLALCLSPQSFRNVNPKSDLFNHVNLQFWEYWLPGATAWGYIACTGTNFAIRAKALAHCGFFPTYTITEDYALGMELKKRGYKGSYLKKYLAVGEAPEEVRNAMRQRSRWCKGHMQVFFSWNHCPLLQSGLSIDQRLWYTYGTWSYFVNIVTVPVFILVPFLSFAVGLNPIVINFWFALSATFYYLVTVLIQSYCRQVDHLLSLWFAAISNTVLWFTQTKAVMNVLLTVFGLKATSGFKVTEKKVAPPSGTGASDSAGGGGFAEALGKPLARAATFLRRSFSRKGDAHFVQMPAHPTDGPETPLTAHTRSRPGSPLRPPDGIGSSGRPPTRSGPLGGPATHGSGAATYAGGSGSDGRMHIQGPHGPINLTVVVNASGNQEESEAKPLLGGGGRGAGRPQKPQVSWWQRVKHTFSPQNVGQLGGVLDPVALVLMLCFCVAVVGIGIWRVATEPSGGRGLQYRVFSPYLGLPMFWAVFNAIAPFLFCVYCFTDGKPFRRVARWSRLVGNLALLGSVILLWTAIPLDLDMEGATARAAGYISELAARASATPDTAAVTSTTTATVTGGWFLGDEPVKYALPLASSAAVLAWALADFPDGFAQAGAYDSSLNNVKAMGKYLQECFVSKEPPVFIAQVGDPLDYIPVGPPEIYTRLADDPRFKSPRRAWVLDQATVGVDVLAASAAALAAAGRAVGSSDLALSQGFIDDAKALYAFAKSTEGREQSYCAFVPCRAEVQEERLVVAQPLDKAAEEGIMCWYPDFNLNTCRFLRDSAACLAKKQDGPVYLKRTNCCSYMRAQGVWNNTNTPQGACALPEGQFECWTSHSMLRSCSNTTIDANTALGCTGSGEDFFPSATACCNQLIRTGAIGPSAPGLGVCKQGVESCFIPDLAGRQCLLRTAENCAAFGINDQFSSMLACCNHLVEKGITPAASCTTANSTIPGGRRLLQQRASQPQQQGPHFVAMAGTPNHLVVNVTVNVTFYESGSVLDDLAWAGVNLYLATKDGSYLGDAVHYMNEHLQREAAAGLSSTPEYYVYNWDTAVWGAALMLAKITGLPQYMDQGRTLLRTWVELKPPAKDPVQLSLQLKAAEQQRQLKAVQEDIVSVGSQQYLVMDQCVPDRNNSAAALEAAAQQQAAASSQGTLVIDPLAVTWEENCGDGVDNDCDGLIDVDDPDCPFLPVRSTPHTLAWTKGTPLPNAASAAFLALVYSTMDSVPHEQRHSLQCWALGQMRYIMGDNGSPGRSYIVGFGDDPPLRVQDRESSCPADPTTKCDWRNGFFSALPNPQGDLVAGALVAGPDADDVYVDSRTDADSRVGADLSAGLVAGMAAILSTGTDVKTCGQLQGLYQDVFGTSRL